MCLETRAKEYEHEWKAEMTAAALGTMTIVCVHFHCYGSFWLGQVSQNLMLSLTLRGQNWIIIRPVSFTAGLPTWLQVTWLWEPTCHLELISIPVSSVIVVIIEPPVLVSMFAKQVKRQRKCCQLFLWENELCVTSVYMWKLLLMKL